MRQNVCSSDPNRPLLILRDCGCFGILRRVQHGPTTQPGLRGRRADVVQHRLVALEGLALPVCTDGAEQPVLDRVPFRRARRIVRHRDSDAPPIGQLLQGPPPGPTAWVVAAAAVSRDQPVSRPRVTPTSMLLPPGAHGGADERRRFARRPDHHEPRVALSVVDAEWDRFADTPTGEVVVIHVLSLASPGSTRILEQADDLLFLGIDADRRISVLSETSPQAGDVAELAIPFRLLVAGQPLAIGSQRVAGILEQATHRDRADRVALPAGPAPAYAASGRSTASRSPDRPPWHPRRAIAAPSPRSGLFFDRPPAAAGLSNPIPGGGRAAPQLVDAASDRGSAQAGDRGNCDDAAMSASHGQQTREQPPLPFVEQSHHAIDGCMVQCDGALRITTTITTGTQVDRTLRRQVNHDHDVHP